MKTRVLAIFGVLVVSLSTLGARAVEPIVMCQHVPISGAAPTPHAPQRFGQFYFDYVNEELGGVDGRPAELRTIDDRFNPTGARQAVESCSEEQPIMYVGPSGVDQIIPVAGWAEEKKVPYLHGIAPQHDLEDATWSAFLSPTAEAGQGSLARSIAENRDLFGGSMLVPGMVVLDSPNYNQHVKSFRDALADHGITLGPVIRVQKEETQFSDMYLELQAAKVTVVNIDVSARVGIWMFSRHPITYDPTYISAAPGLASDVIAQAASTRRLFVLNDPSPVYDPDDASLPWYAEIQRFLEIFERYSPEQDPPPNDFDWQSYLRAKQLHRFLIAADGDYSAENLRSMFATFSETSEEAFPTCALNFTTEPRVGQSRWHAFENGRGRFAQNSFCITASEVIDLAPPTVSCGAAIQPISGRMRCDLRDDGRGVGAWTATASLGGEIARGDAGCAAARTIDFAVPVGVDRISMSVRDCATHETTTSALTVSLPA